MFSCLDRPIRSILEFVTRFLPVKTIRDDNGVPFLQRYHLISFGKDGPGICIHNFVKSDPNRGYHDHPWNHALAFILCGSYEERIYLQKQKNDDVPYKSFYRNMFTFNYLNGKETFHRVMVDENHSVWTIFLFGKRSKTWGMIGLDNKYKAMSKQVEDLDSNWWKTAQKGMSIHEHIPLNGYIGVTVDIIIVSEDVPKKILLIKRGKDPYKDMWALPGGRIEPSDKDIEFACYRELKEETNISNVKLEYCTHVGNLHRDPRGFCVTFVYMGTLDTISKNIRAGDDAIDYKWFSILDLPNMAFDHKEIVEQYVK